MWPLSSPDLNTLDFFWWAAIERFTNAHPHSNLKSLKSSIIKIWDEMLEEMLKWA